jgi:hypothetical protein
MADHSFPDDAARIVRQAERLARLNALLECQSIVSNQSLELIGTPEFAALRPISAAIRALVNAMYVTPARAQKEAA